MPYTMGHYLASDKIDKVATDHAAFKDAEARVAERVRKLLGIGGQRSVDSFHRELGRIMWEHCGMARNEAGLKTALQKIPALREQFWREAKVPGENEELNQSDRKSTRLNSSHVSISYAV